jgi:uncharacterized protein YqeY
MASPQQRVEADLKAALKAGEKERLSTLRLLLTDVKNERIRRGEEVDEETFTAVVRRALKQRAEAAESYRKGGRPELADKEEREAAVLEGYLSKQASEDEVRAAVEEIAAAENLSGAQAMGPLMKAALARLGASADGKTVSRIAREVLTARQG